jgi:hypothetical protein
MTDQVPSNTLINRLRSKQAGSTTEDANLMEEAALEIELLENRVARLRLAPEPPAECLTDERIEEFLGELDGYCDRSEVVRKWFGRATQPPRDGQ